MDYLNKEVIELHPGHTVYSIQLDGRCSKYKTCVQRLEVINNFPK